MRWDRKLQTLPWVQRLTAAFAAGVIRLVHRTTRWQRRIDPAALPLMESGDPVIVSFWHNRLMMILPLSRRHIDLRPGVRMMISPHRDGAIIGQVCAHFGVATLWGSTNRGGRAALQAGVKAVREGMTIGITPDGPRGPRQRAQPGVVIAARLTGAPVLPMAYATRHRKVMRSWDRFLVALPFGRGAFVVGPPLSFTPEDDVEDALRRLEQALTAVSDEADRLCGHAPIAPADPAPAVERRDRPAAGASL